MKPLIIVTVFNRAGLTRRTLVSLVKTGVAAEAFTVVFDNGSTDGATDVVWDFMEHGYFTDQAAAVFEPVNAGCPRALNAVMERYRQPGQAVIKVDNDNEFLTPGWVGKLHEFARAHPEIALVAPFYGEVFEGRRAVDRGDWYETFPVIGHCVYHSGKFLDQTGFFDVLAPDHLYGFEDLLMAHRAVRRGYRCAVYKRAFMDIIQRQNSLDVAARMDPEAEDRAAHVARLRELYDERVALAASLGARYFVNPAGQIAERRQIWHNQQ